MEVSQICEKITNRLEKEHIHNFPILKKDILLALKGVFEVRLSEIYSSVFYSMLDRDKLFLAENITELFMSAQAPSGQLPSLIKEDEAGRIALDFSNTEQTVPFAFLCFVVYRMNEKKDYLKRAYVCAEAWVNWHKKNAMTKNGGLLVLTAEDTVSADLNCTFFGNLTALSYMARELGLDKESSEWKEQAFTVKKSLFDLCFNEDECTLCDIGKDGKIISDNLCRTDLIFINGMLDADEDCELIQRLFEKNVSIQHGLLSTLWMEEYGFSKEFEVLAKKTLPEFNKLFDGREFPEELDAQTMLFFFTVQKQPDKMRRMNLKPIIGLTASVDSDKTSCALYDYVQAIELANGIPIVLPYTLNECTAKEYLKLCDGILFLGGCDIDPERYGKKPSPFIGKTVRERDDFDLLMLRCTMEARKPVMAVCRGAQTVNIYLGGTLIQDIPSEYKTETVHQQKQGKHEYSHSVILSEKEYLHSLIGKRTIPANSFHHQAIEKIGKGLKITATAEDGIIEAFCHESYPYLCGYQWHPERLCLQDKDQLKLFEDLIKASILNKKGAKQ